MQFSGFAKYAGFIALVQAHLFDLGIKFRYISITPKRLFVNSNVLQLGQKKKRGLIMHPVNR